jgi:hypothetical protein
MMNCPKCEGKVKLVKAGNQLVCPKCSFVDAKPAPTGDSFTVVENTITFECGPEDVINLFKEVVMPGEKENKGFSHEFVLKQILEKEPFVGSEKVTKYVIEATYKVIAKL